MFSFATIFTAAATLLSALAGASTVPAARDAPATCADPKVISPYYVQGGGPSFCLSIGKPTNGARALLVDCRLSADVWADWCIEEGANAAVRLAGTGFCLDAGTGPHDFGQVKIWDCYPGIHQQSWTYTTGYTNNTLSITNGTQCLDRPSGAGLHLQTYTCETKNINDNQQWAVLPNQWFLGSGSD